MKSTSYIPTSDSDKGIWLNNFSTKIGNHASALGLSAAEITSINDDAAFFSYILNLHEGVKQTLANITSYKKLAKHAVVNQHLGAIPAMPVLSTAPTQTPEGIFDRISMIVKRIKGNPAYTAVIGNDLGIIAPPVVINAATMQPDLKVTLEAGRPRVRCTKGEAAAIDLYVDRKDGAGFILLSRLLKTDYVDVTNLPSGTVIAEWDYKGIFVIGNTQIGLMSPVVSITVKKI